MSISYDYFHCRRCNTPVADIEDYIGMLSLRQYVQVEGIFKTVFNVVVSDEDNRQTLNGNIITDAYCVQCEELLGGEFIAVPQPDVFVREGRYYMTMSKLRLQPNEDNADQDEDTIDLDEDAPDQVGDTIDLDEDAPHQDGDTTDQDGDSDEQDLGTNGKNADQDVDTTEKNGDTTDQYGDTTEQNGDANEQNANQDLGANEQKVDQDGDASEQVPKEQDVGANEQNVDQDGAVIKKIHDEDGGQPTKRKKI